MRSLFAWFLPVLGLLVLATGRDGCAQVIDSSVNPQLTTSDTVNRRLARFDPVLVEVDYPKLMTRQGVPVEHGLGTYYIYVIRSTEVVVNGAAVLNPHSKPIYLVVWSDLPEITIEPVELRARACLLRGMIDNADSLLQAYTEAADRNWDYTDSLRQVIQKITYRTQRTDKLWNEAVTLLNNDLYYRDLYRQFLTYRNEAMFEDMGLYFIAPYFNDRVLKRNVVSSPWALPELQFTDDERAAMSQHTKRSFMFVGRGRRKNFARYERPTQTAAPPPAEAAPRTNPVPANARPQPSRPAPTPEADPDSESELESDVTPVSPSGDDDDTPPAPATTARPPATVQRPAPPRPQPVKPAPKSAAEQAEESKAPERPGSVFDFDTYKEKQAKAPVGSGKRP